MRIAILGAGAWGTALAVSYAQAHEVALWTRSESDRETLRKRRQSRYLPEVALPASVRIESDMAEALAGIELAIVATSRAGLADVVARLAAVAGSMPVLWACKGFDDARLLPHEVMSIVLPGESRVGALSGPSFALEVARGQPTALVLASLDRGFAEHTTASLNSQRLRIYSSTDVLGVELGGAVKNVIAIAAGISDGLELGRNARAALVTRGLAEIVRLGTALGGRSETFMGLTGLGDLVLTCTGDLSRNRAVGIQLARGRRLPDILAGLGHVAEGVSSAPAVLRIAADAQVEMPITSAVCAVLAGEAPAERAVAQLLARDPRPE